MRATTPPWSSGGRLREQLAELLAGGDVELAEDLVQVILDRARADEQLGADLRVGVPVPGQPRDLHLLGRQDVARVRGDPARGLARSLQLAAGTLGEPFGSHAAEALVGEAQELARVR